MNIGKNKISATRVAGEVLFVSECLSFEAACANTSSRKHSTVESVSSGGNVSELAFSFYDCALIPQEPHFSVSSDVSDQSDKSDRSDYTLIAEAARDFCGWITVTAYAAVQSAVRAYRKIVCAAKALFRRRVFIFEGGLRL